MAMCELAYRRARRYTLNAQRDTSRLNYLFTVEVYYFSSRESLFLPFHCAARDSST